jgi:hypothetical protein
MLKRITKRNLIAPLVIFLILCIAGPEQSLRAGFQVTESLSQEPTQGILDMAFNNPGDIVYLVPEGVYMKPFDEGRPKLMVGVGQRVPGLRRGTFLGFNGVAFNNVGTIAFTATISGGQSQSGIFVRMPGGVIEPIVFEGSAIPGLRGKFSEFGRVEVTDRLTVGGVIVLPKTEVVIFKATIQDGTEKRVGLFVAPVLTREPSVVAIQGASAGQVGFYDTIGEFSSVGFADLPLGIVNIAFQAKLVRGHVGQAIFLATVVPAIADLANPLVLSGDSAPGIRGAKFDEFGWLTYNKNELAFVATLSGGNFSKGIFEVAFLGPLHIPNAKLFIGGTAPGGPGFYAEFGELSSNNNEELVFRATVEDRGQIREGLFKVSLGPLTIETDIARIGLKAPRNEGTVSAIGKFMVNQEGKTAFHARLTGGKAKEGIYTTWANKLFATGITR